MLCGASGCHSIASSPLLSPFSDLSGQMLFFTVQGRWQTAFMASYGWAVCWCQRCELSGPWWRWGYGMGRRMLWTMNTGAFYWCHFECTEIPWRDPEAHCCAINPQPSPHVAAINALPHVARICTQFLEAENIPVLAWPAYSPEMSPIEHVWDALDRRIRQRVPVLKLHILEWPFIVTSLMHTCAIIILSNQHLDIPHLWGGWIISAKEKCSLTQI